MRLGGLVRLSYLLSLLIVTSSSKSSHHFSLVSKCKEYSRRWEMLLEDYTMVHLYNNITSTDITDCSLIIKTFPDSSIVIKLIGNNTALSSTQPCSTRLTLLEASNNTIQKELCILPPSVMLPKTWMTHRSEIHAVFSFLQTSLPSNSTVTTHVSLLFIKIPEQCQDSKHFPCGDSFCIEKSLRCDGIPHCPDGKDEDDTMCAVHGARIPATLSTPQSTLSTVPPELSDSIYLWLPLIVVIVFTVVMLALILAGRGAANCSQQRYTRTSNGDGLNLETNMNPGFSDGGPPTPPPTYSYIERQTSYVSHISQTESQISVPPTYEDAVDIAEDPMSWRRRFRRSLSRSSASRPTRRLRLFQRSMSAQEPTSNNNHSVSDSARRRRASDQTADQRANRASTTSETDSVFIDPQVPSPIPNNVSAPSTLGNLSEVDETVGSSLMLIGPDNNVTTNANNEGEPQNVSNTPEQSTQVVEPTRRPVFARSISDITSGNSPVMFSIE